MHSFILLHHIEDTGTELCYCSPAFLPLPFITFTDGQCYLGLKKSAVDKNHRMSQFLVPRLPSLLGWVGGEWLFTLGRLSGLK